jgi:hypothetical protein
VEKEDSGARTNLNKGLFGLGAWGWKWRLEPEVLTALEPKEWGCNIMCAFMPEVVNRLRVLPFIQRWCWGAPGFLLPTLKSLSSF